MSSLLDANALIALRWPTHEHHPQMLAWFRQHARRGWATTAFMQASFPRIVPQLVLLTAAVRGGVTLVTFDGGMWQLFGEPARAGPTRFVAGASARSESLKRCSLPALLRSK